MTISNKRIGSVPFVALLFGINGCIVDDHFAERRKRYETAADRADTLLQEAGWRLSSREDYCVAEFWRDYSEPVAKDKFVFHQVELFDFLKTTQEPGPERFVISYDVSTKEYSLRSDLRSITNQESLRPAPKSQ